MWTLGSSGLAKHEPRARARCGGGHPGGDEASGHGLDSQVVAALLVDRAVIDLVAFLGPCPHEEVLVGRVGKVILGGGQLDTVAANNCGTSLSVKLLTNVLTLYFLPGPLEAVPCVSAGVHNVEAGVG